MARERVGADRLEAEDVVARRKLVQADFLFEPRAVEEVLRAIFFPCQVRVVEVHGRIQDDLAGRSLEGYLPDTTRFVEALEDRDRIDAFFVDAAGHLEPSVHLPVVNVESLLEVADAVFVLIGSCARRGLDLGHHVGRFEDDFLVDALVDRGKRLGPLSDSFLIPEGHRRAEVGTILEIVHLLLARLGIRDPKVTAAFDVDLQRFAEGDRRADVPTVGREAAIFAVRFLDRHAGVRVGEFAQVPGVVEKVFAAGADDRRFGFAVDVEAVVRFAEPVGVAALEREDGADVVSLAAAVEDDIGGERFGREFLAIAGVEIEHVVGRARQLHPIELPVDRKAVLAFVGQGNDRLFAKGHPPVAIQGAAVGRGLDRQRVDVGSHAVAGGEEIADGRFDRRCFRAVPADPQHEGARPSPVAAGDGEPHVADFAGTLQLRELHGLAGLDVIAVGVRFRIEQTAGGAPRLGVDLPGDFGKRIRNGRRGKPECQHDGNRERDSSHDGGCPSRNEGGD